MEGNIIFRRRSIRKFLDKKIECSKLENILRAAMQAPSANNMRTWEFIVVENKKTLKTLSNISPNANMLLESPMAIVVCGNINRIKKENYWWVQDLSAAVQNILLQAVEEGLGATWLGCHPIQERIIKVKELFDLPEEIKPFAIVSLGYSNEKNYFIDKYEGDKVHFEYFIR